MASIRSRRVGEGISWTFQYATRHKSYAFTFSTLERYGSRGQQHTGSASSFQRPRRSYHQFTPPRSFSTQSARSQAFTQPSSTQTANSANQSANAPKSRDAPLPTARSSAAQAPNDPIRDVTETGLADSPGGAAGDASVDWTKSFAGLSSEAFPKEIADILLQAVSEEDVEVKPDGIVYLPEIKYRRILNKAFGPGGWGLAPRGESIITAKAVTREYALLANGRLISIARGEQDYFDPDGIPTAVEGCKSNALVRCCKDLGIASELWDPRWIRKFMAKSTKEIWVEHAVTKKRRKIIMRKDDEARYPYKETKGVTASGTLS